MFCDNCREKEACLLLGNDDMCPFKIEPDIRFAKEIPFSGLAGSVQVDTLIKPSSSVFCGSPDHTEKREARAKTASMEGLPLKHTAALTLLASTDFQFTIDDVMDLLKISKRTLQYLKKRVK